MAAGTLSVLVSALALSLAVIPPPAETAPTPAHAGLGRAEFLGAVTLITGDHVTVRRVGSQLIPAVDPAPGRDNVRFATTTTGGHLYVVPGDAWRELNAGRLDRRLFDVAGLLRDGYGDDRRDHLPLLTPSGPSRVDFAVLRPRKDVLAEFWKSSQGRRIWLDGMRRPSLDVSVPQIGAPAAWQAGYTGAGVTVAVLDTGADLTHPDLRDRVTAAESFLPGEQVRDTDGHGTHVASIVAGTGRGSGGKYRGVAPGVRLLIGKVCGGYGCPESAILAGMRWAVASGAKVVNLSLGGPDTADDDPLEQAVDALSAEHGTLFVVAAGNEGGSGAETVSSPASADTALAVGAVDDEDALASFSSRGPRIHDAGFKPELLAPGVEITAARSRFSSRSGDLYTSLSGTSMATPHVAGAAAILAQRHPAWSGPVLKAALMGSATPIEGAGAYEQGAGRVDVARAVGSPAYATPAAVSVGRQAWPHGDDAPVTRTVTYHNTGDAPLAVGLGLTATGPGGEPAPEGMFRLSTPQLTVPARGTATVEVVTDTGVPGGVDGAYGARITATAPDLVVATPVAVDREPESYDLTLRPVDQDGAPTDWNFSFLFGLDEPRYRPVTTVGGAGTVRVRKGRYHLDSVVATVRPDGTTTNLGKVVHPVVDVAADTTVMLDARTTRPVTVTLDNPDVRPKATNAGYTRTVGDRQVGTGILGGTFERVSIGQVGAAVPDEELVAHIGGAWAVPDRHGDVAASPVAYHLAWFEYGSLPTGFDRAVTSADLATVTTTYREQAQGRRGTRGWLSREPRFGTAFGFGLPLRLPRTRTEYHNVDGLGWSGDFEQWRLVNGAIRTETTLVGGVVDHQAGQTYADSWNSAVFGPGMAGGDWGFRAGDFIGVQLPLYGDAGTDRYGLSLTDSGRTALYRDGVLVGETDAAGQGGFDVPPERARYRLETRAVRSGVSRFSTEVSAVWTFDSERPAVSGLGKEGVPLPLMAVRFAPPGLSAANTVDADRIQVPVTVQRSPNAPPATVTALAVAVSYDDGATWRTVPVADGVATVDHPPGTRFVSLRATATDSAGNTVEQTIIRGYGVGRSAVSGTYG
ncbi:MAG: S8 family peptidase [Micromonosporaceae bacterium]